MGLINKLAEFTEYKRGISHCTFNPEGPGVVRIHLIPPAFKLFRKSSYAVILNGYYILPLGNSWALLLSYFMREVNKFHGKEISSNDEETIIQDTLKRLKCAYPFTDLSEAKGDLFELLDVVFAVARGEHPDVDLEKFSIRAYGNEMTAPHRVDLAISSMSDEAGKWKCNQRCAFCYAAGQKHACTKELNTQQWKRAIDLLYEAHVPMVTFTGGEPTQRPDLAELVDHAKRMITRVNTNGSLLTEELVNELKAAGLDNMQITLYSSDESIHNTLVGAKGFQNTVNGIKLALESGLDISVNTPLCSLNKNYLDTLSFLRSLGVRYFTASGLICTGNAADSHEIYDLTDDELYQVIKNSKDFCDKNGLELDFTSPGLIASDKLEAIGMNVPMCGAALSNMAVSPDGTVVPCQSWLSANAGLGNILEVPFHKIWNHKNCRKLREMNDKEALSCPFRAERSLNA